MPKNPFWVPAQSTAKTTEGERMKPAQIIPPEVAKFTENPTENLTENRSKSPDHRFSNQSDWHSTGHPKQTYNSDLS